MWLGQQPLQVQGGGTDTWVLGVCCGGAGGVARWGSGLLLSPHEGPPHHGSSGYRGLSLGFQFHPNLIFLCLNNNNKMEYILVTWLCQKCACYDVMLFSCTSLLEMCCEL
ncbi:hypothetical protein ACH5RR_011633 [Cinchona calisaya]|uniref:Uncharacterized protein n=1 Tax=Cinchona calisaya TaxID=153742 RepID=A0ABD3A5I5_9GENT